MKKPMWITATLFIFIIASSCAPAIAAENAGAEKQGIFSGSIADAIWTVIAFSMLVAALGKLAWKPLLAGLKAREERIRNEILTAENSRKQADKTLNEYNSRLEQLHQQARQISEEAARKAQKEADKIAENARQEALSLKQKAQSDIEAAHQAAKERLWDESGDIVLALGGHILGRTISNEDNQRLIREAVEKLKGTRVAQGD
jgi:F-type H+-transporting ATPase subunit b